MKKTNAMAKIAAVALAVVAIGGAAQAGSYEEEFKKGFNDPFYGVKRAWEKIKSWF